ncbi:alpha/beta fold hydrolase [Flavivirga amylovorans]|uniref:Alpha/beta fold hydrolase n=1 Tax=Flavivirga amylovorans TaxID=870486 RepID=A0ABT8X4K3_9FLAO|nr:alpha/beta fold hydrolase [Flavivirga amylovorans]MDO5988627.1 alpha/beta fold hydrolase [Flavivirga amylovorans]
MIIKYILIVPLFITSIIFGQEKRPQLPKKPYPYLSEEITFKNFEANISLSGTLTIPNSNENNNFPTVILISGSGPDERDAELFGHKPFLVLSDYLTRNGIAVLRFDERGTGESEGNFKTATSFDFKTDVESAISYLKTRNDINEIGLIGHSEGGLIAPMAASNKEIKFIILLAGPVLPAKEISLLQHELMSRANKFTEEDIVKSLNSRAEILDLIINYNNELEPLAQLKNKIKKLLNSDTTLEIPNGMDKQKFIRILTNQSVSPWMRYMLKHDPYETLKQVTCPVLVLNGSKDLQVPSTRNLDTAEKALREGSNINFTIQELPNLNHLFQECTTGSPNEYAEIEQTLSPVLLSIINSWIKGLKL